MSTTPSPASAAPRRVLVATKYRFIGDTLLAVPLLRAVRAQWPQARVTLMTGGRAAELLLHCPYIDDVIEFDPYRPADEGLRRFFGVVAAARRARFDLALVCNRSFHSALIAALGGARRRIGWSGFQGRDFLLTGSAAYSNSAPEIDSYLDLLGVVAPSPRRSRRLELWVTPAEREEALGLLPDAPGPLIGFQPGATHADKRWPARRYAELAALLAERFPAAAFVLLGAGEERPAARELIDALPPSLRSRVRDLVGACTLRQSLGVLSWLDLLVAADTAVRHAAVALDTPTVAVFGPTSTTKWGNGDPPRHALAAATPPERDLSEISAATLLPLALDALASAGSAEPARAGRHAGRDARRVVGV